MRLALSGYYGCGNTGDEAVLDGIARSLTLRRPDERVDLVVLSASPDDTRRRHEFAAVDRMSLLAVRRALKASDLLISGGGSLLQDATSLRSLLYYLWVIRLARVCRTPVMVYAQGVGPLRSRTARAITRVTLNRVGAITVRDPESAALLRAIGVTRPPLEVTADPAFVLDPVGQPAAERALADAGIEPGEAIVGLALRPVASGGPSASGAGRIAEALARRTGARVLFMPMQPPGDARLAEEAMAVAPAGSAMLRSALAPRETLAVVGRLEGLVAMRLHALIFAAMTGVPMVALAYDPKVVSLMADLGQAARCLDLGAARPDAVAAAVASGLADRGAVRRELLGRAAVLRERALVNADRALELAKAGQATRRR